MCGQWSVVSWSVGHRVSRTPALNTNFLYMHSVSCLCGALQADSVMLAIRVTMTPYSDRPIIAYRDGQKVTDIDKYRDVMK